MQKKDYKGIYVVKAKDVMKATLYENGCLVNVPCAGIIYYLQRFDNEKLGKLPFVVVKDYETYYKEYTTDLPLAKGKNCDVPLYISEDASLKEIDEAEAESFIAKLETYKENFQKLYASGANAVYNYKISLKYQRENQQKVKTMH